jgi:integration host factor subunit beta
MAMTKSQLVQQLVNQASHISQKDMSLIVDTVFDSMIKALGDGDRIELRGFGTFEVRVREPRTGRNPKSGSKVSLGIRKVPFFKAGKELKEMINSPRKATVRTATAANEE